MRARSAIRRGLVSVLALVLFMAGALVAVSRTEIGAAAITDLLERMAPAPLVLAAGLMSAAFVFMALRWRALMPQGTEAPVSGLTAIILGGLLLNYAVPGPFGELGAAWFAHRRYKVRLADALAAGVTARLVGLATAAILSLLIWLIADLPVPDDYQDLVSAAALIVGLGGGLLALLAARPRWWQRCARLATAPLPKGGLIGRLAGRGIAAVDALAVALHDVLRRGPAAYARAVTWALCGHLSVIIGIHVATYGLGADASSWGLAFTYATTTAGAVALFALPGSYLGWDAMFGALLVGTSGLELADAVAIALLVRLQQLSFMVIGAGVVGWLLRDDVAPRPS